MLRPGVAIAILSAAVLFLQGPLAAAPPDIMMEQGSHASRSADAAPMIHDIQLKTGNCYRGQLPPSEFPESRENILVRFYRQNHLVAETRTDRLGRFTLRYLPEGIGTLSVTAEGATKVCFCRLWAPGTAPNGPGQDMVARSQGVGAFPMMSFKEVATFAAVAGGAVAAPVVWHNVQQDHKAPVSGS